MGSAQGFKELSVFASLVRHTPFRSAFLAMKRSRRPLEMRVRRGDEGIVEDEVSAGAGEHEEMPDFVETESFRPRIGPLAHVDDGAE